MKAWMLLAVPFAAAMVAALATTAIPLPVVGVSLFLGVALVAAGAIDIATFRLPDALTLPLLLAGLCATALLAPQALPWHLAGAIAGYGLLVAISWTYRALRGREGLGRGDAKLLAAGGAWVGLAGLSTVLALASATALIYVIIGRRGAPMSGESKIPFGPFLGAGIWLVWLFGPMMG